MILTMILSAVIASAIPPEPDLQILYSRLIPRFEQDLTPLPDSATLQTWLSSERANGSWADIDYFPSSSLDTRSYWPPLQHMERVKRMAAAWSYGNHTTNSSSSSSPLLVGTISALEFWLSRNLTNPVSNLRPEFGRNYRKSYNMWHALRRIIGSTSIFLYLWIWGRLA